MHVTIRLLCALAITVLQLRIFFFLSILTWYLMFLAKYICIAELKVPLNYRTGWCGRPVRQLRIKQPCYLDKIGIAWLWLYMGSLQHLFLSLQSPANETECLWNDCWNAQGGIVLIKIQKSFHNSEAPSKFSKGCRVKFSPAAIFKNAEDAQDSGFELSIVFVPPFLYWRERNNSCSSCWYQTEGIAIFSTYSIRSALCAQINLFWIPEVFTLL